jgi:hypothetical protein
MLKTLSLRFRCRSKISKPPNNRVTPFQRQSSLRRIISVHPRYCPILSILNSRSWLYNATAKPNTPTAPTIPAANTPVALGAPPVEDEDVPALDAWADAEEPAAEAALEAEATMEEAAVSAELKPDATEVPTPAA